MTAVSARSLFGGAVHFKISPTVSFLSMEAFNGLLILGSDKYTINKLAGAYLADNLTHYSYGVFLTFPKMIKTTVKEDLDSLTPMR